MQVKKIVILANSIKKGARCLAGREISVTDDQICLGPWIRPVSNMGEGELYPYHYNLSCGNAASVLDIVEIPFLDKTEFPGQPENCLIDHDLTWKKTGVLDVNHIDQLRETPSDIWLDHSVAIDRISDSLQANGSSSLVIIQPSEFTIRLWTEFNLFKRYNQKKNRGVFKYAGTEYNFSITDPLFTEVYCKNHPKIGEEILEIQPHFGDNCFLCISLTPPFNGNHYKVIATVLPFHDL